MFLEVMLCKVVVRVPELTMLCQVSWRMLEMARGGRGQFLYKTLVPLIGVTCSPRQDGRESRTHTLSRCRPTKDDLSLLTALHGSSGVWSLRQYMHKPMVVTWTVILLREGYKSFIYCS